MSSSTAAARSSASRLQATIMRDRDRIARGERPSYRVTRTPAIGSVDVRIVELPLIHIFVPDEHGVLGGARVLIARTLQVDVDAFDVRLTPSERS